MLGFLFFGARMGFPRGLWRSEQASGLLEIESLCALGSAYNVLLFPWHGTYRAHASGFQVNTCLGLVSKGNQHNFEFCNLTQMESSGCFFVELLAGFCGTCQPLRNQITSIWGPLVVSVARFSTRPASPGHLRPSERETKRDS